MFVPHKSASGKKKNAYIKMIPFYIVLPAFGDDLFLCVCVCVLWPPFRYLFIRTTLHIFWSPKSTLVFSFVLIVTDVRPFYNSGVTWYIECLHSFAPSIHSSSLTAGSHVFYQYFFLFVATPTKAKWYVGFVGIAVWFNVFYAISSPN